MIPDSVRRAGWIAAFAALTRRAVKGLRGLDDPLPEDQPAKWPPLPVQAPQN